MQTVALLCSAVLVVLGLVLLVRPQIMHATVGSLDEGRVRYSIALVRLLLGCVLLAAAENSRYPQIIEVLGWVLVIAGLLIVTLPPVFWRRFIALYKRLPSQLLRFAPLLLIVAASWLVYSFT
ncbi:DUF2065 family protein [Halieaceae bacterium IMCC14734]|uniref:DUF2065 family protein n=1 Tax=Candidatus Litorirhabdus singularis TaxID=2518993 RepID=A0ABT3TKM9_9GAMM|nr:hypothetical protein [Candidatus Litorirhabdus singularis]MCX2982800.1 DUF2065 family protein [Candidatus Litorirhabdus singularis]